MTLLRMGFFLLCALSNCSFAGEYLPESHPVNGGISIIPLLSKTKPLVYFNNTPVAVINSGEKNLWLTVIGIPLDAKEAIQQAQIVKPASESLPFYVSQKAYTTQRLHIKEERKVNPFEEDKARIAQEEIKLNKLYATLSERNPFAEPFNAPLKGPVSSLFGLKRIYNNQERPPHSGLDIAAPEGNPVLASNAGKVIDTGDYFYTGNTVIIDHGMGVFSLYGHLQTIQTQRGAEVQKGGVIGTVGHTGRATGPHLHWSMIMNKTLVDPLLFVTYKTITTLPPPPKPTESQKDA